ncbi:hypothetical protein SVIOM342S_08608 [Streptomyces violaceorubidus]
MRYGEGHPAVQCVERAGSVRASAGVRAVPAEQVRRWASARQWPEDTVHGLCAVLRSRGRTLGVVTFLRGAGQQRLPAARRGVPSLRDSCAPNGSGRTLRVRGCGVRQRT